MLYPTTTDFYKTGISQEDAKRLVELSPFKDYSDLDDDSRSKYTEKVNKCKKQLAIIVEQEKPQGTEQEEKAINYWASQLADFRMKGDGEAYLLNLKEQIEAKYRSAMADVESKLQQCRANRHQKESYFSGRLQTAQQQLESIRSFKSKPRIRAEMELADAEAPFTRQQDGMAKKKAYEKLALEIKEKERVWLDTERRKWQEEQNQKEAKAQAPPIKRGIKRAGKHIPKTYDLIAPSYTYQYSISQTDEFKGITTKVSFAAVPWSPMSCLA